MDEIGIPSPATPPPLPPTGPRPVLPLDSGPLPPPLPAPHVPAATGPYYKPPVFFETPAPVPEAAAGGEPQWLLWGIGGLVVVMIGIGAGFFVAVRNGPSQAVARNAPPPPAWKPVAPVPPRAAPVGPPTGAVMPPRPVTPRPVPPPSPYPLVALPAEREVDLQLKKLWQAAEQSGLRTKTMRTLKSTRGAAVSIQPVRCDFTGDFSQAVLFLQGLRTATPAVVVEWFELAVPPEDDPSLRVPVAVGMTANWYFAPDADGPFAGGAPLCPLPDVAGALADLSKAADSKLRLTRVAVKVDGATATPGTPLRAGVTVEGHAQSDVDVAGMLSRLKSSRRVSDVNLIQTDARTVAGQALRAFKVEFAVRPRDSRGAAPLAVQAGDLLDPFAPPAWGPFIPVRPKPPAPAIAPLSPADAAKAVQSIELESITATGRSPTCVINGRLYRAGNQVNGLTIDRIGPDGIVLRAGEQRFEVKLKTP